MSFNPRTPFDIVNAYVNGLPGAICNIEDTEALLNSLPMPLFGKALAGSGKGKLALLYKYVQKFEPEFGSYERQVVGDCVSHATRNAIDVTRAFEILELKEAESFLVRSATEGIYGSRGHSGEGMSCSGAAKFVTQLGGVLLRQKYGSVDLTTYDGKKAASWGRSGVPKNLVEAAKKNPVETASLIRTTEEARDALANGYAMSVCSNVGFSVRRDDNGIADPNGSWNHAMAWIAVDDTHTRLKECLFLVQNSWGMWNGGPKIHEQPDGSFWIRESVAARMLAQNGAWVYSNVVGFPPRKVTWTLGEVF